MAMMSDDIKTLMGEMEKKLLTTKFVPMKSRREKSSVARLPKQMERKSFLTGFSVVFG